MRFYLKVLNPAIAFISLLLCFWAATYNDKEFSLFGIVNGGLGTYFIAKGLFVFSSLLMVGKILSEIIANNGNKSISKKSEYWYCLGLIGLTVGLLAGMLLLRQNNNNGYDNKELKCNYQQNPKEIKILESYPILESYYLKVDGKIFNESKDEWKLVKVAAEIFLGGRYADRACTEIHDFSANDTVFFEIKSGDILSSHVKDSVSYLLEIQGCK